jgi:hypothetical protein
LISDTPLKKSVRRTMFWRYFKEKKQTLQSFE